MTKNKVISEISLVLVPANTFLQKKALHKNNQNDDDDNNNSNNNDTSKINKTNNNKQ